VVEGLKSIHGDDLRVVYRHFPLINIHDKAQVTAEAGEAAGAQGKFWEMHDILFERQSSWSSLSKADMLDVLVDYAEEIGLDDVEQFKHDLENETYADKVLADYEAAQAAGLPGTPSFFINQLDYPAVDFNQFQIPPFIGLNLFIKMAQLKSQDNWQWYTQPEQVIDPEKEYIATIETEQGDIVVELYPDTAPVNVNSFAFLAQQGWYKGVTFHRVLPGFVAQGGDPLGLGFGFPGYRCSDEVTSEHTFDGPGVVALANSGPNTNGAQFFITYAATPNLNEGFTILGQVIEGQDVAESLTPRNPENNPIAPTGDKIIDISIEEKN
jgi:cyclophilin family peptidyl-prolyl cis-trans isomerase